MSFEDASAITRNVLLTVERNRIFAGLGEVSFGELDCEGVPLTRVRNEEGVFEAFDLGIIVTPGGGVLP